MTTSKFYTANGQLTAYAFRCGYVDRMTRMAASGLVSFEISHNGTTYDVDIIPANGFREWRTLPNGTKVIEGWAQFSTLKEAREFRKRAYNTDSLGMAYANCFTHNC